MKAKYLLILVPSLLTGCAVTKWIVENEDAIAGSTDAAESFGPYGAIVGLLGTSAIAAAKWYEHKGSTKDLIEALQKAKADLDPKAKKLLVDGLAKHTPDKVKRLVKKVKGY